MVFLLCLNALSGGFSVSIYKVIGELLQSSAMKDAGFLIAVLLIFAICSNILQMHLLNLAMKYYDQIEVIPICMTTLIVCQILCGLFFLNEIAYYNAWGLTGIFIGSLICTLGIMILMRKNSFLESEKNNSSSINDDMFQLEEFLNVEKVELSERKRLLSFLTEKEIDEDN